MKNISPTIVFFGTEDFSLESLRSLIDANYNIAAVITKPDSKRGRGQLITPPPVKELAQKHGIQVWQPTNLNSIVSNLKSIGDNITGVLVSYGKIIPQSIIDLFQPGIINVHPSLLPRWRGPSPIEAVIKNGDESTGVTIMQLSAEMDAGPVYKQVSISLNGAETKPQLYETLSKLGANLLAETLPAILDGTLKAIPQDNQTATYCSLLTQDDTFLNTNSRNALEVERLVRAHLGFPRSKLIVNDKVIIITRSHVSEKGEEPLSIKCRDGLFLSIDELIAPSGRKMSGQDFVNGYAGT